MNSISAYPLCWPEGRPRTAPDQRSRGRFQTSFASARNQLIDEIRRLGGTDPIFSSNIPRRADGLPYANYKPANNDPGIAVYFKRKGRQMCFACDRWQFVDDNMHAIALTVEALRGIARWGTGDMMEAAFRGYAALPQSTRRGWWEILGVPINASLDQIKSAYRAKALTAHPDRGGTDRAMAELSAAYDEAQNQR